MNRLLPIRQSATKKASALLFLVLTLGLVAACSSTQDDINAAVRPLQTQVALLEQESLSSDQSLQARVSTLESGGASVSGDTIQARRLEILDAQGNARIVLSTEGNRPSVALADADGQVRGWLFLRTTARPT